MRGRGEDWPKSYDVTTDFQVCFDIHAKLKVIVCQVPPMLQHSNFNCAKSKIYRTYLDRK